MSRSFFFIAFIFIPSTFTLGQGMINNGAHIVLGTGSFIIVKDTSLGNFQNQAGGTVANSGIINLEGNWINNAGNAAFTSNSGEVVLSGGDQQIAGSSPTSFYSLIFSGTGTKKLLTNAVVGGGYSANRNGLLNLNDRVLDLNSNTLVLTNSSPIAMLRNTGYVISETDPLSGYGKFLWLTGTATAAKNYSIPFGRTDGTYIPYQLNFTSNGSGSDSSGFIASTYPTPTSPSPGNRPLPAGVGSLDNPYGKDHSENALDRYWVNMPFGFTAPPKADVVYAYNEDEWDNSNGSVNTIFENELGLLSYSSGKWQFPPKGSADFLNNRLSVNGQSPFGIFTLANPVECPTSWFSFQNKCQQEDVLFSDSSSFRKGSITGHSWDFGDAGISNDSFPLHNYSGFGTYQVKHVVTLSSGCRDTAKRTLTVYPKPIAAYSFNGNQCEGIPVLFNDKSTTPSGSIISREWDFADGQLSNLAGPVINYISAGKYAVRLVVENTWSCRDTIIKQVQIYKKPVSQFTVGNSCSNAAVIPDNNSLKGDAGFKTFKWLMGDGSSSNLFEPSRKYAGPGNYNIQLIVTDSNNCADTASQIIAVNPSAIANFDFNPKKPDWDDPLVNFSNQSMNSNSWYWDFGDGAGSSNFSDMHTYPDTGYYTVTLTAGNDFNCLDTITKSIYIEPVFRVFVPNSFTPNGDLLNDTFGAGGLAMGAKNSRLTIYNRWGALIFVSNDINDRWDGTYNDSPVQSGTYSWMFETDDYRGARHSYSGVVTLLR